MDTRGLYYALALQLFAGDFEGFLKNLDGLLGVGFTKNVALGRGQLGGWRSRYSRPLQGLPDRNVILTHLSSKHVIYSLVYQASALQVLPVALREKAREEGWETEGREQLEEFAKKIPQVKDGLLRALLFQKIGLYDEALAEMNALGQEGSLEEKLDVLSFQNVTSRQGPNEVLLSALLAMERDGLSRKELSLLDGVTLGEAMKNRRLNELDAEIREDLANVLRRFVKGPGGRAQTSSLQRLYQSLGLEVPTQKRWVSGSGNRQPQSYRQLLSAKGQRDVRKRESEQDRTERRFFEQVKGTFSSSDALGRLQRIVREERYLGLQEKALAFYEPGESLSYLKRMRFAQLCLAYDEREKAREVFLRLQEERPYDDELGMLIFRTQEAKEQAEDLDVKLSSGEISTGIDWVALLVKETDEEELFFGYYERLVSLMRRRAEDFSVQDEVTIFNVFKRLQRASKNFEKRSIHEMSRRLPRVKKGEDSKEGDWAVRTRQRKILLDAYGEMLRMRSIRDEVMAHIIQSQEALRLSDGHVEWIVLAALKKEAVKENERAASGVAGLTNHFAYRSRGQGQSHLALQAVLEAEVFSAEVVDQLERHVFLSEKQGALIKAALNGDAAEVESLLEEYEEASQAKQSALSHRASSHHQIRQRQAGQDVSRLGWVGLLESLLRSERWEKSVREMFERALFALKGEEGFKKWELLRVCELGSLDDSLAALEAAAAEYFPVASKHESYEELRKYGAVPDEVLQKVSVGQSLFTALQNIPRAWIPLLTFAEKSDQAVWVTVDEGKVRSELRRRLDVMYKAVLYDRLREEGFDSYDGLALLGEERWTDSGELSLWLESLIAPLKLAPTEGRTYWANVSQDCREQVEQVSYLEAFIAMRKDFQIEDEERQKVLRQVLESELEELSGLSDDSLIGLRNLIKKDFPELEVSGVSEELDELLTRLRGFPVEGVVKRIEGMIGNEKAMAALSKDEAKGLCACLASEGEVELAAEFWVAFLNGRANGMSEDDFSGLNFNLLARNPFMGKLNLVDSVRFVRLVKEGLVEHPEMTKSMTYTRGMLQWSKALSDYSSYRGDPAGVLPFLDEMLQGDGVTEADKRVIGGFLIKANLSGRGEKTSNKVFRLQLLGSGLAEHSPGVVETMLALSQLQGGRERKRVKEEDVKAVKVIYDYVQDQELAPDFRGDLAEWLIAKFERDNVLLELADAEPIGMALRDLLMRGSYGVTGNLSDGGVMLNFVNQHLATVPEKLQGEIYEAWVAALKVDARKVLAKKVSSGRLRLGDLIFDFTDGGRRFPLPEQLVDELARSFRGDLDLMQKLIRAGNGNLVTNLVPDVNDSFRIKNRTYSSASLELENEILPVLSVKDQVMLKCYFGTLRDSSDWKESKESVGHLQQDRVLAAAHFFVANLPEEQAVRLRAIRYLESSVEALKVLMPLFDGELQDDVPALAEKHRGDLSYLLRWIAAGGEKSVSAFAPDVNRPIRMSGIRSYSVAVAELERLLSPLLNAGERMQLTCDLALLREPKKDDEEEGEFLRLEERLVKAARYILANPLPEADREEERKCILQLIKGGLGKAESEELLRRGGQDLEAIDVTMLSALDSKASDLFARQLRASLAKEEVKGTMTCLRILADPDTEIAERQRLRLMGDILPKIALPLIGLASREKGGDAAEQVLVDLKNYSGEFFEMSFSRDKRTSEEGLRAVIFLAFASHCLLNDREGYEQLNENVSTSGKSSLDSLVLELWRGYEPGWYRKARLMLPVAQPLSFDTAGYFSDEFKPLRKLFYKKICEHSFLGFSWSNNQENPVVLMDCLCLTLNDVEFGQDEIAAARGNMDLIMHALLVDNRSLFLSLIPTQTEVYFQEQPVIDMHFRSFRRDTYSKVEERWANKAWVKDLALIEDDFQRMHLEVYLQRFSRWLKIEGTRYDKQGFDVETENRIVSLLPESGPAREQVLIGLAGVARKDSSLAKALIELAGSEGFKLLKKASKDSKFPLEWECLSLVWYGWIFALHEGDWSVLDFQLQKGGEIAESEKDLAERLVSCAGIHALYQVAGEASFDKVFEKIETYGLEDMSPESDAWIELAGLVAGEETSRWKDAWRSLDANQQVQSKAEMAAALVRALERLGTSPSYGRALGQLNSSANKEIWLHPDARDRSKRVITAIMDDELELFSTVQISVKERVRLLIPIFDWQQMKDCIESRFEGEGQQELLTELAFKGQFLSARQDDFHTFVEDVATRLGGPRGRRLWFRLARYRISIGDLAGAKAVQEKLEPSHLGKHEVEWLQKRIEELESETE